MRKIVYLKICMAASMVSLLFAGEAREAAPAVKEPLVTATNVVKRKKSRLPLGGKAGSTNAPPRDSIITADRIEFDNKEGVILFDNNVLVDDAQFVMRSEQLLVFTDGTNDIHQIMAIGSVNLTNENRSAVCDRAVYTRKDGQIVMTGNVKLLQHDKDTAAIEGNKITIWVDDERMLVEPGRLVLPPGMMEKSDRKVLP